MILQNAKKANAVTLIEDFDEIIDGNSEAWPMNNNSNYKFSSSR